MGAPVVRRGAKKVLIANRGEIACRIIAALREEGMISLAIASEPDRRALHVRRADEAVVVGGAAPADSYLAIEKIVRAAQERGAWAVHPGYGFLAENARFAAAVEDAGLAFLGPRPETIALLGDKRAARALAAKAGAPIVPGWEGAASDAAAAVRAAKELGYPVLVKAALGGGGKGMTKAHDDAELAAALESASRVAAAAFGDAAVYLEKWIESPRHVEVQLFGDGTGEVVHLFERECSLQRRHQKVFEESPSPGIDDAVRPRLVEAAVAIGRAAKYRSAGTCEFLVDGGGRIYFLEVNARIQVEHPVTELVTGIDLVREQIRSAASGALSFSQGDVAVRGAAVEARLCAEDPAAGFLPQAGPLVRVEFPRMPGVRVDTGFETGDTIAPHYDSLIAKIVVHAPDRGAAWTRLAEALAATVVHGPTTNLDLLRDLARHPEVRAGRFATDSLEKTLVPEWSAAFAGRCAAHEDLVAFAAALADAAPDRGDGANGANAAAGVGSGRRASPYETLAAWRHPGLSGDAR